MSTQTNNTDSKQKLKKYIVFGIMFLAFAGCMWLIFAPSEKDRLEEQRGAGFNDEVPSPLVDDIVDDKRNAYELDQLMKKREDGMITLNDYSSLLESEKKQNEVIIKDMELENNSPIQSSVATYQDINRNLGNFYQPANDEEQEQEILALEYRIQEMERKLEEKEKSQSSMDEQLLLMEKSYEMAAKYMPTNNGMIPQNNPSQISNDNNTGSVSTTNNNAKAKVEALTQIAGHVASSLPQNYAVDDLVNLFDKPRNTGFHSLGAEEDAGKKNTIKACIHNDQTILSGQSVCMRLLEPIRVESCIVPRNTLITGQAVLQGERLDITVSSIEYSGNIYPVQISIHDNDGIRGIHIPASMEMDAFKEMVANMGTSMSSISITDNAGSQIAGDLTRGLIQGTSQLFAKKLRMIKVNLKAGHHVLLYPENK